MALIVVLIQFKVRSMWCTREPVLQQVLSPSWSLLAFILPAVRVHRCAGRAGRRGMIEETKGGDSVLTHHPCAPLASHHLWFFLLTGSPGHTGSTSMSPSAALSTGKPMDSHPSYTDTPVSAPRTLSAVGTPLNALGSPYRVITSAMGPPSGALAAPPGINLVAPPSSQVGCIHLLQCLSRHL